MTREPTDRTRDLEPKEQPMTAPAAWANPVVDRAVGAVLASAAGDAMGAPYEFGPPDPLAPCRLEGGGAFAWAPGEWTDDTQLAVAILAELAGGSSDVEAIGRRMLAWYRSGPRDVGNQTRAVLGAAAHGEAPATAAAAFQRRRPDAAGNGALMRTGPVALAHLGDRDALAALAAEVAALTHPHPDSMDACVLWSLAVERAVLTARPDAPFDWTDAVLAGLDHLDPARRDLWRSRVADAVTSPPEAWAASNGWVVGAFQAALSAITGTAEPPGPAPCRHLELALQTAARAGGDTDTVAAIAGALLGARWGASAVPLAWQAHLHGRRTYDEAPLRAEELMALARLAVRLGVADGIDP